MSEPWLPILETNQGTISVAALVLALVGFLWELYRANTQRQRELEQEIEEAILLIEDLEQFVDEPDDEFWLDNDEVANDEVRIIATALRALATAHVKKPTLSLPLLRAAQIADTMQTLSLKELEVEAEDLSANLLSLKGLVEAALKEAKRRVVFSRAQRQKSHALRRKVGKVVSRLVKDRAKQKHSSTN